MKKNNNLREAYTLDIRAMEAWRSNMLTKWLQRYLPGLDILPKKQDHNLSLVEIAASPDYTLVSKRKKKDIAEIKTLGTDLQPGTHYWINEKLIEYLQKKPERDIWLACCVDNPKPSIIWIKPEKNKIYKNDNTNYKGFVYFDHNTPGYYASEKFVKYIKEKLLSYEN